MNSSSGKKSSKSQKIDPIVANTVEMEINNVFTDSIKTYNRIKIDSFYSNTSIITDYIKYLNYNIHNNVITLRDVNFTRKGKIIDISLDSTNNNNIKIKYNDYNSTSKLYDINVKTFVENIYILNNNTIFYLSPGFKFRKEKTPKFASIIPTYININYFKPTKKSFVTPSKRSIKTSTSGKPFYSLPTDKQLKHSRSNDDEIKIATDVVYLLQNFKGNNIDTYIDNLKTTLLAKATTDFEKNKINNYCDELKKRYNDSISMPPPPSKKSRISDVNPLLGGNTKSIKKVRKVYIDNNNRKYIKYNKNIIVYLR